MDFINEFINTANNVLWTYILIAVLVSSGIYFTIRTKFVQFRYLGEMIRLLGDKNTTSTNKNSISSFAAFCISTASRVGMGNLAGVATAIAIGGPGAIFWMWMIALMGGATAFIESTLAQVYKIKDGEGFRGGPAYYMEKGLGKRWLGIVFAILITICFGLVFNSLQSNTIALSFKHAFGVDTYIVGIIITILTAITIFGGVKSVAVASKIIVPALAVVYLAIAFFVVVTNITELPVVLKLIVTSAFGMNEVFGGMVGGAILMGVKRGLFSNEAGMGSAPNAAATADVSHPAKQGLVQSFSVFFDTLLICSATAFIVLLSGENYTDGVQGIELLQNAVTAQVGSWGSAFMAVSVFLFAFSSIIGNYYYGETNIEFIKSSKITLNIYRILVVGMVIFGSVAELSFIWNLADLFMGLMALINLGAILILGKIAFQVLNDYTKQRKEGKDPVFYKDNIEGIDNVEAWERSKEKSK